MIIPLAESIISAYTAQSLRLATAESCTGGLIVGALTEVAGSSSVVECGFVTYSNAAKTKMLGVPPAMLQAHGAVSAEVAQAMAEGALVQARVNVAIAVTGIAGPGGATAEKPVGLVYIALATQKGLTQVERHIFAGSRAAVREQTIFRALTLLNLFAS